jgi:uncharacterized YigZ family protein
MADHHFTYKTIITNSIGLYSEKGSKFIAILQPLHDEKNLKSIITQIKNNYPGARHYCYALITGFDKEKTIRSSDDGEPSGTAGKPILNQLLSFELTNVCVVVVRYFGGVLLGSQGLIKAYKLATFDSIQNTSIIEKKIMSEFSIQCNQNYQHAILQKIKNFEGKFSVEVASESIDIDGEIPKANILNFKEYIEKIPGVNFKCSI